MSVVVKPVFSIDDRKLIAKYMKEYEVNSELEVVLEVRIWNDDFESIGNNEKKE